MTESEPVIVLPPGSQEAGKFGCTCPVLDNCYGKGFRTDASGQPMFWMSTSCPIHGERRYTSDSTASSQ